MIRKRRCRAAGAEFMRAAVVRMDRCALATWLVRQYAPSVVEENEHAARGGSARRTTARPDVEQGG